MITLLIFLAVLAVLVLSHEFGHFIVARKNGIKVDEFGFGFPPRLCGVRRVTTSEGKKKWQWVWGSKTVEAGQQSDGHHAGTLYSFNIIPLGGFVKIKGEDGSEAEDPDSFAHKKFWQKASVLVAGVAMNVITATILLSLGFMIGLPVAVGDEDPGATVQNKRLEILQVLPEKPAAAADIKPGDVVRQVGDIINPSLPQFQQYISSHAGNKIPLTIVRGSQTLTKEVQPTASAEKDKAIIGVGLAEVGTVRYPWYTAIYQGILSTGLYLKAILLGFAGLIRSLLTGGGAGEAVSGPVGIAVMTGQVARLGIVYLMQFAAMLSLNLAVLNILPIPALDGGRLLFVIITKLTRRPIKARVEQIVHTVGFVLLMLLVIVVTVKDLGAFGGVFMRFFQRIF